MNSYSNRTSHASELKPVIVYPRRWRDLSGTRKEESGSDQEELVASMTQLFRVRGELEQYNKNRATPSPPIFYVQSSHKLEIVFTSNNDCFIIIFRQNNTSRPYEHQSQRSNKMIKKAYYWIQMRFARRAWISTNRKQAMHDYHKYMQLYEGASR